MSTKEEFIKLCEELGREPTEEEITDYEADKIDAAYEHMIEERLRRTANEISTNRAE